jgi:hypothetical protein
MLFSLVLLGLLEVTQVLALVPRKPAPVVASNDVCKAGIYVALAPLAYYSPAQSFCASKYPHPRPPPQPRESLRLMPAPHIESNVLPVLLQHQHVPYRTSSLKVVQMAQFAPQRLLCGYY